MREWQCGTNQVDFNLPERFDAFYIDADSEKQRPVMLHTRDSRLDGAFHRHPHRELRRSHFPLWLAPVQAVVATIVTEADDYGRQVQAELQAAGFRVETDFRNEKINYKVREHSLAQGSRDPCRRTPRSRRRHHLGAPSWLAKADRHDFRGGQGHADRRSRAA